MAEIPYNPTTEIVQESLDFIANLIFDCVGLEMLDYWKSYQVRRVNNSKYLPFLLHIFRPLGSHNKSLQLSLSLSISSDFLQFAASRRAREGVRTNLQCT